MYLNKSQTIYNKFLLKMDKIKEITLFGKTNFRNKERAFGIKRADRRQHTYIVGKTGTGKSALITNMAIQDIINGHGVCIVDPHGELIETIIKKIPAERLKDVIYFNPIDTEYPIGFNVLEVSDPKYKHLVSSDLMAIFTKIWENVWSARMEYILSNCVLALLDTPGTTLLGIPRILVDKDYRQQIISNIKDPVVKAFWINEYETWRDQFRNEAIVPIQNKVGQFLSTSLIRNIVGQQKSTINIQEIMNSGKIFMVNISKGRIGEDNSALLGAMIITKIQLAAMERVRITEEGRKDFYLYVDEFQNFATESFAAILSEARKYRLNLTIAHQYIGQLVTSASTKIRDAIFGNVGTMIIFRVGATDAEFLEKELTPEFTIEDMVNLPNYNIYLKLMVDGVTSRPFSALTLPPLALATHEDNQDKVIELSRKNYARPKSEVEYEISSSSGIMANMPNGQVGKPGFHRKEETEKYKEKSNSPFQRKEDYRPKFKYAPHLGEIGIEFETSKYKTFEKKPFVPTPVHQPIPIKQEQAFKKFDEPQKSAIPTPKIPTEQTPKIETKTGISLESLKNIEMPVKKEQAPKISQKEPAIDELKEAIKKAISEA
ncbi:MAG: type IV secretion system DNA-binding domain-containing protein [Patescibacteria group bacterium]